MIVHAYSHMQHDPEIHIDHRWTIGKIKELVKNSYGEEVAEVILGSTLNNPYVETFSGVITDKDLRKTLIPYAVCKILGGVFLVDNKITLEYLECFIQSIKPGKINMTPPSKPFLLSYESNEMAVLERNDIHYIEPPRDDWSPPKVSVISLMKDAEQYLPFFTWVFSKILETTKYTFEFYIMENDSKDNSEKILKKFMEGKNGTFYSGPMEWNKNIRTGMSTQRGEYMSNLRNELKRLHGTLDSEYTVIMDTDVYFKPNCIFKLIRRLKTDGVAMSTCFGDDWSVIQNYGSSHYYDTFALITHDNITHKETGNKCLFPGCKLCEPHLKRRGLLDRRYSEDTNIIEVNSAFGGIVALKTEHYNATSWEPTICEHHGFCESIRKFGKIIISRDIETMMAKEHHDFLERSKLVVKVLGQ